jgi:hypothetical protein
LGFDSHFSAYGARWREFLGCPSRLIPQLTSTQNDSYLCYLPPFIINAFPAIPATFAWCQLPYATGDELNFFVAQAMYTTGLKTNRQMWSCGKAEAGLYTAQPIVGIDWYEFLKLRGLNALRTGGESAVVRSVV